MANSKMSKKQLEILKEIVEDCGGRWIDDYSGRGMLGQTCVAIVYDDTAQIADICEMLSNQGQKKLSLDIALRWKSDSMGMGFVRYNH